MSRPLLAEPPPKRQRAPGEEEVNAEEPGDLEEDREFRRLEAVSAVQDELNALEDEEAHQVLMVHKAFLKRKRPLYSKRQEAIAEVPDFWLKVLLAHPLTQPYISDGDQLALSYLESVAVHKASSGVGAGGKPRQEGAGDDDDAAKVSAEDRAGGDGERGKGAELDDDDDVGFRVTFTFRENPFFSNKELWREWEPAETQQATFSVVKWKETEEAKELQSCLVWNIDPTAEHEEAPSFFSIFCEDMDDYELGEALRGDITDNPLDIYMRHDFDADEEEDEDGEGDESEGGGMEDDEGVFLSGGDGGHYVDAEEGDGGGGVGRLETHAEEAELGGVEGDDLEGVAGGENGGGRGGGGGGGGGVDGIREVVDVDQDEEEEEEGKEGVPLQGGGCEGGAGERELVGVEKKKEEEQEGPTE